MESLSSTKPSLTCHQCSMVFTSIEQLSKHREKFCVGAVHLDKYGPYYINYDQKLADEKIKQLQALKEANITKNNENDIRDRLLLSQSRVRDNPEDDELRRRLQRQFNRLYDTHEKNVTDLKAQKAELKKSRNNIQSKIAELKRGFESRENLENKASDSTYLTAIEDLRNQIAALRNSQLGLPLHRQPNTVIPQHQLTTVLPQHQPATLISHQPPAPVLPHQQPTSVLTQMDTDALSQHPVRQGPFNSPFSFSGGSLVAEISALRQHYINTGGKDPLVISQLTEMLKEAEEVERYNRLAQVTRQQPRLLNNPYSEELVAMELENNRLQRELLQFQNNQTLPYAPFSDTRMYMERMLALEREVELAKHQALLDSLRNDKKPTDPAQSYYSRIDNVPTDSYKPEEGFVCFYDFVMGLETSARLCRLVVGLYDRVTELGEPSLLPTVYTETSSGGNTAMVGARQPVPQCPASREMYLLVELQTSDSTLEELSTKAWLKLDVFNARLALNSGAWKLTFHSLPIKPDITTAELSSHPRYHDAMLYMRIIHHRDSLAQSQAVISAANYIDYQYPPVTSKPSASVPPADYSTPQF